jgi:hypothetical protein
MSPPGFQHIFFAHLPIVAATPPKLQPFPNSIQSIHIQPCLFFTCPFSSVINYPSHPRHRANPPARTRLVLFSQSPLLQPRPSSQLKGNHFACAPECQDLSFSASDPSAFVFALPLCRLGPPPVFRLSSFSPSSIPDRRKSPIRFYCLLRLSPRSRQVIHSFFYFCDHLVHSTVSLPYSILGAVRILASPAVAQTRRNFPPSPFYFLRLPTPSTVSTLAIPNCFVSLHDLGLDRPFFQS